MLYIVTFLFSFSVQNVFAEWSFETLDGVQVHYYLPKKQTAFTFKKSHRSLMVNLHGCSQKAEDLKKDGNWETTADDYNMIVALPKVPNGGVIAGCWDYYGADHTENNRHNVAIIKLVKALLLKKELDIDPGQVYLSGLSSGGGQTMVLGCLVPEIFAGIGINAGPSTGTTSAEISKPKTSLETMLSTCKNLGKNKEEFFATQLTSIIYGNNDYIVNTAFNTFNAEIMSSLYGAHTKSAFDLKTLEGANKEGTGALWSDSQGPRVSLIMNTNLGHNWPAGQGGNGGNFISKKSLNYPNYLARFFYANNRRSDLVVLPEVMIDPIEEAESQFVVSGVVTNPEAKIKSIEVLVVKNENRAVVDRFKTIIKASGEFRGQSRKLSEGEYHFTFQAKNQSGKSRTFKRRSWIGNIPGINMPQLVSTKFQSVQGCVKVEGQAVNNGGDKVIKVKGLLDGVQTFETSIENTRWSLSICGLEEGSHSLSIVAENESGLSSHPQVYNFISSLNSATSTLQEHMEAKRLNWEEYGLWYLKYGYESFTLYLGADEVWSDKRP